MQSHTDTNRSGEYLLSQSLVLLAVTAAVTIYLGVAPGRVLSLATEGARNLLLR